MARGGEGEKRLDPFSVRATHICSCYELLRWATRLFLRALWGRNVLNARLVERSLVLVPSSPQLFAVKLAVNGPVISFKAQPGCFGVMRLSIAGCAGRCRWASPYPVTSQTSRVTARGDCMHSHTHKHTHILMRRPIPSVLLPFGNDKCSKTSFLKSASFYTAVWLPVDKILNWGGGIEAWVEPRMN